MFVLIGKLIKPLVAPLTLSLVLWGAGALIYWRRSRAVGLWCGVGGIGVLLVFGNGLVADALLGSLENDYPAMAPADTPRADVVVVLGGITYPALPPLVRPDVGPAFDRLLHGLRLLRAGRAPRVMLSGGGIRFLQGSVRSEAQRLRDMALEYGAEPDALILEERSRNTYENALFSAELMRERGWERALLVTSAAHMPRAVGCFRTQGVEVIPAPADFQVVPRPLTPDRLLPTSSALDASSSALKEYAVTLAYRMKGWIR